MSSSARSGAANLVPLRLERSESAASLEYFFAAANHLFKAFFLPHQGSPPLLSRQGESGGLGLPCFRGSADSHGKAAIAAMRL